jgi:hypothetical protein
MPTGRRLWVLALEPPLEVSVPGEGRGGDRDVQLFTGLKMICAGIKHKENPQEGNV